MTSSGDLLIVDSDVMYAVGVLVGKRELYHLPIENVHLLCRLQPCL